MRVLVRRVIQLIVVLVVVTFFTSILTALLPGDPVTTIAPFSSEQDRANIRNQLNLNENVVVRYGKWLGHFLTGDMGREYAGTGVRGQSIWGRVKDSLPRSLLLMLYVQILTLLIAVPLGVYTAYRAGTRFDDLSNGIAFLLLSIPVYVTATLMLLFLSVQRHLLPTEGWVSLGSDPVGHFKHLAMPVMAITIGQVAVYARLLRSDMVATLQEDYILMAKSKGISDGRVLWRHALRPSSLTLLTVAGLNVGQLIGGALIVEVIFHLNGLGFAIGDAINRRQYIALQDYIAVVAIVYVLVNVAVDMLYRVLDPRIRGARIG
ncbi:MAG: peptide/nickel transport system permease protein [Actinomycetota bacterium]|nr:peptide/nickel transport system permease protein [Actinomycetota bacterium]